jgi:hypothetical protein
MKIKFWTGYLFAVLIILSGIYYATAQMSDVPFILSDSQMEQLTGAEELEGWICTTIPGCPDVLCNSLNLKRVYGHSCKTCETAPNNNNVSCTPNESRCTTCLIIYYENECGGWFDYQESERTWVNKCD